MGDTSETRMPNVGLQTDQHEALLNAIDALRSQGISRYIDLPQLVVCGDQSSGKSSVLEAISGLKFPTKDNLCTRFATEVILRRAESSSITVSIIPGANRSEKWARFLRSFKSPSTNLDDFPKIVAAAEDAMELDKAQQAFTQDILRVELGGRDQPNLTLVDLPGIIWAGDQSVCDRDVENVHKLVTSYMEKRRSIILAVVSAKSDVAMQIITKQARKADPSGQRTMGIITKPDLLFAGSDSEKAFVKLAKNENIHFKLGWHVLKNRDYDTRDSSTFERDVAERAFFDKNVWSAELPPSQLGIAALRPRLSDILLYQILTELPGLMAEINSNINMCKRQLEKLGGSRTTISQQRAYLFQASQTFVILMSASVDGKYSHTFFGSAETDEGYEKRLRAVVQRTLEDFSEEMQLKGHTFKIVNKMDRRKRADKGGQSDESTVEVDESKLILKDDYLKKVQNLMGRRRGRELPGLFNPEIIDDLFYEQAEPWEGIIVATARRIVEAAELAIKCVLEVAADTATVVQIMKFIVRPKFEVIKMKLNEKVREIMEPHLQRRLLTFNHYFALELQELRGEQVKKSIANKIKNFFNKDPQAEHDEERRFDTSKVDPIDLGELLRHLSGESNEADMNRFAAMDAMNAMQAYYKVGLHPCLSHFSSVNRSMPCRII